MTTWPDVSFAPSDSFIPRAIASWLAPYLELTPRLLVTPALFEIPPLMELEPPRLEVPLWADESLLRCEDLPSLAVLYLDADTSTTPLNAETGALGAGAETGGDCTGTPTDVSVPVDTGAEGALEEG